VVTNFAKQVVSWHGGQLEPAISHQQGHYLIDLLEHYHHYSEADPDDFVYAPSDIDRYLTGGFIHSDALVHEEQFDLIGQAGVSETLVQESNPTKIQSILSSINLATDTYKRLLARSSSVDQSRPRPRRVWEVFAGKARASRYLKELGAEVTTFGLETGWGFSLLDHQRAFMQKLSAEEPDEVFLSPMCGLWSAMQEINAVRHPGYAERPRVQPKLSPQYLSYLHKPILQLATRSRTSCPC